MNLADIRQFYAEEIHAVSDIQSKALVAALAKVPRELFLGPGPWQIVNADPWQMMSPSSGVGAGGNYRSTDDADPRHLYHNVLVAIDANRKLNNGLPSAVVWWLDCLDLRQADRVLHVGCGTGYYTAIIAEVVGPTGHVIGIEIDADNASEARKNLSYLSQAEVILGDGGEYDPGPVDAIFVSAGATHPCAVWLSSLKPEGRLILPLTMAQDETQNGSGLLLKLQRVGTGFVAHFLSPVMIYSCLGSRDAKRNEQLWQALARGSTYAAVQSLRTDQHVPNDTCWLHDESFCLSTAPVLAHS